MALSPSGQPDRLIWKHNANGIFTVRSAYHLAVEQSQRLIGESSAGPQLNLVWQKIWQLRVPGGVKTFLWRMCNNSLPTKVNLHQRKVTSDSLCPLCEIHPETTGHVLWHCAAAQDVWMESSRRIQKLSIGADDGFLLFEQLMDHLDDSDLEMAASIARHIWYRRNRVVFEGKFSHPAQVAQKGLDSLELFRQALADDGPNRGVPIAPEPPVWKKPALGQIKSNWDAALDLTNKRMGVGVIVRDFRRGSGGCTLCYCPFHL
ncbi:hypothetical protein SLA2020_493220 [Shorea laevis]